MISFKIHAIALAVFIVILSLSSCFTEPVRLPFERASNENHARNIRDFDGYYPNGLYRLSFKIGDRFKLKEPMFLYLANTGVVQLHPASKFSTPSVKKYSADPDSYKFGGRNNYQVIRLVPRGEVIQLVAIKHSSQAGYLPYFVFEGKDQWFRSSTFAISTGTGDHSETHDRKYFAKLPAP